MALRCFLGLAILASLVLPGPASEPRRTVEFNRDVRPILADNCFSCHGPDNNLRKARLRLDRGDDLFGPRRILVAGKPLESELFKRIRQPERSGKMPPAHTNKTLTQDQVSLLRLWIEQGAKYEGHWAFLPPSRAPLPRVNNADWPRNPIDHFILARLEKSGKLAVSAEADRRTLVRRLSFDLSGLPPTPAEVETFCADPSAQAYEQLVERLFASPHFGERMAQHWLDLVRYADSNGYYFDHHRDVYLYRDWVIEAFRRNLPFDQFTIAQLAGDLVPGATASQRIASGYNHLLQINRDDAALPKEVHAKYDADRIRNLSSVWLGLTMGCCECHDHKFDPISIKDFYALGAFFGDVQEDVIKALKTSFVDPDRDQEFKLAEQRLTQIREELPRCKAKRDSWKGRALLFGGSNLLVPWAWTTAALSALFKWLTPLALASSLNGQTARLEAHMESLGKTYPRTVITKSGPARTIRVLPRGDWMDETGEVVAPVTPAVLPPLLAADPQRATRLDLAHWLVAPHNPLPARVFVNRLWRLFFGQGLLRSLDDFGSQGGWPMHPELLDWLAVEFRESGWDVQHVIRLMVLSSTYRQTSLPGPAHKREDPANELCARQGRFRLDAEMIRDNALRVSGLLADSVGGPSVKPYQPAGYWENTDQVWSAGAGDNLYRRGLYTFWKRTFLHPSLLIFDAPSRDECAAERMRSNTPQQALVLLNDPIYVEAARVFAQRIILEGGTSAEQRIRFALREALQRPAGAEEITILRDLFEEHLAQYRADPEATRALLFVGASALPGGIAPSDLAAWTSVAQVILNLPESITRY